MTQEEFEELATKALEHLCDRYLNDPDKSVSGYSLSRDIGVNRTIGYRMVHYLTGLGAVEHYKQVGRPLVFTGEAKAGTKYRISPGIFAVTEAWKANLQRRTEAPDKVLDATNWVRRHRVLSYIAIAVIGVSIVATAISSVFNLIDRFVPPPAN